ncbi:uncharacterized protein LOC112638698 [Camponotus floridanus]|uniref:uncharacterized protein LOC112638698 n=1 Tax=Camponotus floridanus TaxID=104421 RepID=UPI000DC6ACFC|nr:uncharacterized protein LOC112638698 [Camponotus floridanus]
MKHDVTTSLSDVRVPDELKTIVTPDHSYRKVEYARRREYVDSPTCVPSLYNFSIAQIQTEPRETSVVESQTPSTVVKETPMQTFAKCEYCEQFMQTAVSPEEATRQYLQCPQWSYPAIVQFIRGGASMPCCPGCKCATGTVPQSQSQPLSSQRMKSVPTTQGPETSNTLTSEATQQIRDSMRQNSRPESLKPSRDSPSPLST